MFAYEKGYIEKIKQDGLFYTIYVKLDDGRKVKMNNCSELYFGYEGHRCMLGNIEVDLDIQYEKMSKLLLLVKKDGKYRCYLEKSQLLSLLK